ncbi:hypothetical protein ATE84_2982 [Aquimarina sp. MAR_2010_214]|uniref:DUF7079 family protein n=1 Tax=Aquimarina sp. MAR_2010_214 TaxID=1250026 RepID=UPI000CC55EFA|nr:hypothetical protein [Aquimarina sp. MAR_2010_214]PKV50913.1 hypothetical protein ATE84_2982 [Aquimarina sp. MAR_2010_214]
MKTEKEILKELKAKWQINPFNLWIPLSDFSEKNTCYFNSVEFNKKFGFDKLNRIYNSLKTGGIYEFTYPKETKIIDKLNIVEFSGNDTFYVDKNVNYMIYLTHERTIAFAGDELINQIKKEWIEFEKFINPWEKDDSIEELEKRIPIWNSISEFYLDTELQSENYESITNTFLNSDLHISELKEIDLYEVFPVLKRNQISLAGEWNGFDEKWLHEACTKAYLKRNSSFFRWKTKLYNRFLYSMRKDHWIEIENRIKTHYNNVQKT